MTSKKSTLISIVFFSSKKKFFFIPAWKKDKKNTAIPLEKNTAIPLEKLRANNFFFTLGEKKNWKFHFWNPVRPLNLNREKKNWSFAHK